MKNWLVIFMVMVLAFLWSGRPEWVVLPGRFGPELHHVVVFCLEWKLVTSVLAFVIGLAAFMVRTDP